MYRGIIFALVFLLASVSATDVKKCNKGQPFPLSVEIEGCINVPCDVIRGKTAVMYVHFVGTKNNIQKITTKVHATALGITVPYELPADVADVCSNLMYDAMCPIDETEDVVYKFNFLIDPSYPEVSVKVEASLLDEDKESVACFNVDVKVKKGQNQL